MFPKLHIPCLFLIAVAAASCRSAPPVPLEDACSDQDVGKEITTEGYLLMQDPLSSGYPCYGQEDVLWCFLSLRDSTHSLAVTYSSDFKTVVNPLSTGVVLQSGSWLTDQVCDGRKGCALGLDGYWFRVTGRCSPNILSVTRLADIRPLSPARPTLAPTEIRGDRTPGTPLVAKSPTPQTGSCGTVVDIWERSGSGNGATVTLDGSGREVMILRDGPLGFTVGDHIAVNHAGYQYLYAGTCP